MSGMDEFSDGMKKALQAIFDSGFKAGREQGMREAAGLCEKRADFIRGQQSGPQDELSNVILRHHASAHRAAMESILSAIEGAK